MTMNIAVGLDNKRKSPLMPQVCVTCQEMHGGRQPPASLEEVGVFNQVLDYDRPLFPRPCQLLIKAGPSTSQNKVGPPMPHYDSKYQTCVHSYSQGTVCLSCHNHTNQWCKQFVL